MVNNYPQRGTHWPGSSKRARQGEICRTLNRHWTIRPGWAMMGARCGGFPALLGHRGVGEGREEGPGLLGQGAGHLGLRAAAL